MKKVLIVDDHSDIRRLIRITLGNGFEVLEAEDGETSLKIIRSEKPDLVVLDVMMPGNMDGLKVLDSIMSDAELKHIHVIMVTARGQVSDYENGLNRGAEEYFIKPFSPLQLVTAIKETLAE
ncbi:MAG: response regulator [Sideroxydans sp.]|jgi:DNA-binding response OmpR family regulator